MLSGDTGVSDQVLAFSQAPSAATRIIVMRVEAALWIKMKALITSSVVLPEAQSVADGDDDLL